MKGLIFSVKGWARVGQGFTKSCKGFRNNINRINTLKRQSIKVINNNYQICKFNYFYINKLSFVINYYYLYE